MKCFLKIQSHVEDLSNYKYIKQLSDAANQIIDDNNFNCKIDNIDYVIDTRGYIKARKTFDFIKKYNNHIPNNYSFAILKQKKKKKLIFVLISNNCSKFYKWQLGSL